MNIADGVVDKAGARVGQLLLGLSGVVSNLYNYRAAVSSLVVVRRLIATMMGNQPSGRFRVVA